MRSCSQWASASFVARLVLILIPPVPSSSFSPCSYPCSHLFFLAYLLNPPVSLLSCTNLTCSLVGLPSSAWTLSPSQVRNGSGLNLFYLLLINLHKPPRLVVNSNYIVNLNCIDISICTCTSPACFVQFLVSSLFSPLHDSFLDLPLFVSTYLHLWGANFLPDTRWQWLCWGGGRSSTSWRHGCSSGADRNCWCQTSSSSISLWGHGS